MKVNFDAPILDHRGKPMPIDDQQVKKAEGERELSTLRTIAEQALCFGADPDHDDVATKTSRWALFRKLGAVGEIDLAAEEVTLLKRLIGVNYSTLVMGRAFELLDPVAPVAV